MSTGRIVAIAAGLLIAAGAFFLVAQSFSGTADVPEKTPEETPAAAPEETPDGGKKEDKAPPSGWQSFIRPDDRTAAPPRPVVRLAQGAPNPFDRLPEASGGGGGVPREKKERPDLRLQGISFGSQAVALLSGHAVRVGDTVSGYRVSRIDRSAVTLAGPQGDRYELALREDRPADGDGR